MIGGKSVIGNPFHILILMLGEALESGQKLQIAFNGLIEFLTKHGRVENVIHRDPTILKRGPLK